MRIRIENSNISENSAQMAFFNSLKKAIEDNGMVVTDKNDYDLLHAVGAPTQTLLSKMRNARRRLIPVVYSPFASITPWNSSCYERFIFKSGFIHAVGENEQKYLQEKYKGSDIVLIKNPAVTHDISQALFTANFKQLYDEVIIKHEQAVKDNIAKRIDKLKDDVQDNVLKDVLKSCLYMRYRYHRRQISQNELDDFSTLLIQSDYDEDKMAEILDKLKVYDFMQSLEKVMEEKSQLTEGFMPIAAIDNNLTNKIKKTIL
jgi:hypothetical protein